MQVAASRSLEGLRAMIVEDNFFIADEIRFVLENAGAVVCGMASTSAKAIHQIDNPAVNFVVLDVNLIGGDIGPEVAQALRRRRLPFGVVTGYDKKTIPSEFAQAPILSKPFTQEQLLQFLVDRRHEQQAAA